MYLFGEADKLFYFFLIQTSFISIQACTPTNIIVENITKNSSIILWDMPYQGNSTLCWEYWNGYYHHSQCQTVPAPRSYYKLTGLVPDAHYQVSINSSCGYGSYGSETTLFTTLPGNLIQLSNNLTNLNSQVRHIPMQSHCYINSCVFQSVQYLLYQVYKLVLRLMRQLLCTEVVDATVLRY